jgi:hypothetical protein
MERNTTVATAGQGLILSSGGAIAGTADLVGGDLILKSGIATGIGSSAISFSTATAQGSTNTTDNLPTEKMKIYGNGQVGIGIAPITIGYGELPTLQLVGGLMIGATSFINWYISDARMGSLPVTTNFGYYSPSADFEIQGYSGNSGGGGGGFTRHFHINDNGQSADGAVGIGTVTPTGNLQVSQRSQGFGLITTNGTTTIVGVGTKFTNVFKIGDTITVWGETARIIATITDDTHLTSTIAFSTSASSLHYTIVGSDIFTVKGNGNVSIGVTSPTASLHLRAGTTAIGTAPLKFISGPLISPTPEVGAIEFLTDAWYGTITTNTVRRMFVMSQTGRTIAQTAANASVLTFTLPATDGSYQISANVLVTTSSAEAFTVTCTYTDESNTARVATLNFQLLTGTIGVNIAFANGAVPYMGIPLNIRCKASTSITIATVGIFTGCTYNAEAFFNKIS